MRALALLLGALLALPSSGALAADGDKVASFNRGTWRHEVYKLCDNKTGDATCAEFNLNRLGVGIPDAVAFAVEPNSCSSSTVQPRWKRAASGTAHNLTSTISHTGTTAAVQDLIPGTIIDADLTSITCTGITVIVTLMYQRDADG